MMLGLFGPGAFVPWLLLTSVTAWVSPRSGGRAGRSAHRWATSDPTTPPSGIDAPFWRSITSAFGQGRSRLSNVALQSGTSKADALKKTLIRRVAKTDRGFQATSDDRKEIMPLIVELERLNEIQSPINSTEISGTWSVLYTAPANETDSRAKSLGYVYGPIASRLRGLLPKGLIRPTGIFQTIDSAAGRVRNIAEFVLFEKLEGRIEVGGDAVPIPPKRFEVTFTDGVLYIGDSWSWEFSLKTLSPKGWVDITFLQNDFRLTRGDKGTVFVVSKVKRT